MLKGDEGVTPANRVHCATKDLQLAALDIGLDQRDGHGCRNDLVEALSLHRQCLHGLVAKRILAAPQPAKAGGVDDVLERHGPPAICERGLVDLNTRESRAKPFGKAGNRLKGQMVAGCACASIACRMVPVWAPMSMQFESCRSTRAMSGD